jgi:hypothetical protein
LPLPASAKLPETIRFGRYYLTTKDTKDAERHKYLEEHGPQIVNAVSSNILHIGDGIRRLVL